MYTTGDYTEVRIIEQWVSVQAKSSLKNQLHKYII